MGNAQASKFTKKSTALEAANNVDLNGKIALVTGCNTGIGKETVRVLAIQGAKVYMLCRNLEKANNARDDLVKSIKAKDNKEFDENNLIVMQLDLNSLLSVRRFVGKFTALNEPIDFLINNGGIMNIPQFTASKDGYESQFAVNHLGHFYLSVLLTPVLVNSNPARVIALASSAHSQSPKIDTADNFIAQGLEKKDGPVYYTSMMSIKGYENYGLSKVCNILFAREYNRRYSAKGVISVSVHPGVIPTGLMRNSGSVPQLFMGMTSVFQKTIPQGAATTLRCVTMGADEIEGGHYYKDCNEANESLRKDIKPNRGIVIAKKKSEEKPKKSETETAEKKIEEIEDDKADKVEEADKGDKTESEKESDKIEDKSENVKKEEVESEAVKEEVKSEDKSDETEAVKEEAKSEDKTESEAVKGNELEKESDKIEDKSEKVESEAVKEEVKSEDKSDKTESKVEVKESSEAKIEQSAEYKLWQWSELLITQKGFNLDMDGFEEEEQVRAEQEAKEAEEERLEKERLAQEEADRVEKEAAEATAKVETEKKEVESDKKEESLEKATEEVNEEEVNEEEKDEVNAKGADDAAQKEEVTKDEITKEEQATEAPKQET